MSVEEDRRWMRLAIVEAGRGLGWVEPNPMVGAVVVRDGQLVGKGHHQRFGGPHAEVHALTDAGDLARGATIYVTLEPCCHQGKTPPCSKALIASGVARVVVAHRDPFPRVDGGGVAELRRAGIEVEVGLEASRAIELNAPYLKRVMLGQPYVTAKWAMTLDGRTACASGDSRWISNEEARARVHELRGRVDVVAVGIGTALADDPKLTARPAGPRVAARLVLDPSARLPLSSQLVSTSAEAPTWLAVNDRADPDKLVALERSGCQVLRLPGLGAIDVSSLLTELGRRGVTNLMVEGGSKVLGSFFDAKQVDALDVYVAPKVEGGTHGFSPATGRGARVMAEASLVEAPRVTLLGDNIRVEGRVIDAAWIRRRGEVEAQLGHA